MKTEKTDSLLQMNGVLTKDHYPRDKVAQKVIQHIGSVNCSSPQITRS